MTVESERDVEGLKTIGRIVAQCLEHLKHIAAPGMTTLELDARAGEFLSAHGARSAPKITYDFPGFTCISINSVVAHGIPSQRVTLRSGDLINVDVSAELDGYFADTGASFGIGKISPEKERLIAATQQARDEAISNVTAGAEFKVIGKSVSRIARKHGFRILEDLQSHGVGRALHEEPKFIPSHLDPHDRRVFREGMVLTIEPFLTTGPKFVQQDDDGWSLCLPRGHLGAQFEHTLIVTKGQPILTTLP